MLEPRIFRLDGNPAVSAFPAHYLKGDMRHCIFNGRNFRFKLIRETATAFYTRVMLYLITFILVLAVITAVRLDLLNGLNRFFQESRSAFAEWERKASNSMFYTRRSKTISESFNNLFSFFLSHQTSLQFSMLQPSEFHKWP